MKIRLPLGSLVSLTGVDEAVRSKGVPFYTLIKIVGSSSYTYFNGTIVKVIRFSFWDDPQEHHYPIYASELRLHFYRHMSKALERGENPCFLVRMSRPSDTETIFSFTNHWKLPYSRDFTE